MAGLIELLVIVVCLLTNALLSCVEMAFVTVSKPHLRKLAQNGDRLAKKILDLRANPERILSVLQIGISLVASVSAAIGGAGAEDILGPYYQNTFHVSKRVSESLAIISLVLPLTYFSVVIGELVPKTLALRFPMRFAKFGSFFWSGLMHFFAPLVFVLEHSTKILIYPLVKRLGSENSTEPNPPIDLDDLSESHKQYVLNLIGIDKRKVKDILLPWDAVVKIEKSAHHSEVMNIIRRSRHTRLPVIEDDVPFGILQAKEFISEFEIAKMNWIRLLRPIIYLSAEDPILKALKILQSKRSHMAIVLKKSEILGIVTLEDIFEEVVGDIYDEDDNPRVLLSSNSKMRQMDLGPQLKGPDTSGPLTRISES